MTLAEIRDDALETLNNYGERFTVEVAKLYPDDPDDDMGEMTITAMSRDGKRVLFRDTCFVRPTYRTRTGSLTSPTLTTGPPAAVSGKCWHT